MYPMRVEPMPKAASSSRYEKDREKGVKGGEDRGQTDRKRERVIQRTILVRPAQERKKRSEEGIVR